VKETNPSPDPPPDQFLNLEEYVKPHFLTLVEYRRERNDEMRKNRQEKERASRDEMNVEEGEVVEGEINRSTKSQEVSLKLVPRWCRNLLLMQLRVATVPDQKRREFVDETNSDYN